MTIQYINTGTSPNAGNGDSLRVAFSKINANFSSLAGASSVDFPSQTGHAGQFLTTDGGALSWSTVSGTGVGTYTVTVSNIAPVGASTGQLWYDDVSGRLYVWYDTFWVDASPRGGSVTAASTSTLVNGTYTFALTTSGTVVLNGSAFTGGGGGSSTTIQDGPSLAYIDGVGGSFVVSISDSDSVWTFGVGGDITFPGGDVQHAAYTGPTFPTVSGNNGKYLTTDGSTLSWSGVVDGGLADSSVGISVVSFDDSSMPGSGQVTVTYNVVSDGAQAAGIHVDGQTINYEQNVTGVPYSQGNNSFTFAVAYELWHQVVNIVPYVVDGRGYTFYSAPYQVELTGGPCFVEGTEITMADGLRKPIEDIQHGDLIKVWNFDLGEFTEAKPLWVKQVAETTGKHRFTFSDGTVLETVGHHVFNKEAGKFTYFIKDETPIGTTTFNDKGQEVTLISKEKIIEPVRYYNVWTQYHLNLFANGILTSNRFNNIYPISDMKFVKDDRTLRSLTDFEGIDQKYIDGLRLQEQTMDADYVRQYIRDRLIGMDISNTVEQGI